MKLNILLIVLTFSFNSFAGKTVELLSDPDFLAGFYLKDADPKKKGEIYSQFQHPRFSNQTPQWSIGQWHTIKNLENGKVKKQALVGKDKYKTIKLNTSRGTKRGLYLLLNSKNVFYNQFRKKTDAKNWPHIYIVQKLDGKDVPSNLPAQPRLGQLSKYVFKGDFKLLSENVKKSGGYDPKVHAERFLVHFILKNMDKKSPNFGERLSFTISLYDSRERFVSEHYFRDPETNAYVYRTDILKRKNVTLHGKGQYQFRMDMLPEFKKALKYSKDRGDFSTTNLNKIKVVAFNFGWENSGLSLLQMHVKDISIKGTYKD